MPLTINFNIFGEVKPEHHQEIIYLKQSNNFGFVGFGFRECIVEYHWAEIDEDGNSTGTYVGYTPGDKQGDGYKLEIMFDDFVPNDKQVWVDVEEYWKSFDVLDEK